MHLLATIRRIQAPLICLAIACVVSAGCRSVKENIGLGQPLMGYLADDGSVLFGYHVEPVSRPKYTGWHWLVIEPDTASLLTQALPPDATASGERVVAVTYKGWSSNARLIPPLLEPGLPDPTPPVVGDGGLTELRFVWDAAQRGPRLLSDSGAMLALMQVSPDYATLRTWTYRPELMLGVLRIVAIAALIAGLILLGGSADIQGNRI